MTGRFQAGWENVGEDHWCVDVVFRHECVLTIESNGIYGKADLTEEEKHAIRNCARHLLAFVGEEEAA